MVLARSRRVAGVNLEGWEAALAIMVGVAVGAAIAVWYYDR
jgi:hypothetical protein